MKMWSRPVLYTHQTNLYVQKWHFIFHISPPLRFVRLQSTSLSIINKYMHMSMYLYASSFISSQLFVPTFLFSIFHTPVLVSVGSVWVLCLEPAGCWLLAKFCILSSILRLYRILLYALYILYYCICDRVVLDADANTDVNALGCCRIILAGRFQSISRT